MPAASSDHGPAADVPGYAGVTKYSPFEKLIMAAAILF
jgi:hypothetical protein